MGTMILTGVLVMLYLVCEGLTITEPDCPVKRECPGLTDRRSQIVDGAAIQALRNCTVITGGIFIGAVNDDPNFDYSQLEVLSTIVEIRGLLRIQGYPGTTFPYLRNLRRVGTGEILDPLFVLSCRGNSDITISFEVTSNAQLIEIDLSSLEEVSGGGVFHLNNPNLCFTGDIAKFSNSTNCVASERKDPEICIEEGYVCHPECLSRTSCWGREDHQCADCLNFSYLNRCVTNCSVVTDTLLPADPGVYVNEESRECEPCHPQCAGGCVGGTGPENCVNCSSLSIQIRYSSNSPVRVCVESCPVGTYLVPEQSECLPCHEHCSRKVGCAGPLPYLDRDNGCRDCSLVQLTASGAQDMCVTDTCGSGYYRDILSGERANASVVGQLEIGSDICVPCDDLCANCTGPGIRIGPNSCQACKNATRNGLCISECSADDTSECLETGLCAENGRCIITSGSFQCICDPGFIGDGNSFCQDVNVSYDTDIDECLVFPCAENSSCTNTPGSFQCTGDPGFVGDGTTTHPTASESGVGTIVGGVIGAVVAVVVAITVAVTAVMIICKRRIKHSNGNLETLNVLHLSDSIKREENRSLKHYSVETSFAQDVPKHLVILARNLELGKTIGQGEFGIVYRAKLKSDFTGKSTQSVAVKTLRGFVERELVKDLLKECAKMCEFDHPNVLKLTGVCLDGGPAPYIVMPFMINGSLLSYLKEDRQNLILDPSSTNPDDVGTVKKTLLDMCIQVAKGMEYLASKRVIHRDLAARNCMIDINFIIKVADFGLAESLDTNKEYFRQGKDAIIKLPIKWMAPESINDGVFSEKSDVWSYGVTCWEIFNGGKAPYSGMHPNDIPYQLEYGYRMERPRNAACTDDVYSVMLKCWKYEAALRPNFAELMNVFVSNLNSMAGYMDFNRGPAIDTDN